MIFHIRRSVSRKFSPEILTVLSEPGLYIQDQWLMAGLDLVICNHVQIKLHKEQLCRTQYSPNISRVMLPVIMENMFAQVCWIKTIFPFFLELKFRADKTTSWNFVDVCLECQGKWDQLADSWLTPPKLKSIQSWLDHGLPWHSTAAILERRRIVLLSQSSLSVECPNDFQSS